MTDSDEVERFTDWIIATHTNSGVVKFADPILARAHYRAQASRRLSCERDDFVRAWRREIKELS
jgi:hypothetical protein